MIYEDGSNKYYISKEATSGNKTDSLLTFYDIKTPSLLKMVGFEKNGFRNGIWNYNLKNGIDTITWAHYKDKYLGFETNIFTFTDSVKYGKWFTKFLYKIKNETLILSISINGPLKDSLPNIKYDELSKKEIIQRGVEIISFETKKISNENKNIYINSGVFKTKVGKSIYIEGAHGFIDSTHFVELSVSSENGKTFHFTELFNAVFANFYIDGKRFYQPILNGRSVK